MALTRWNPDEDILYIGGEMDPIFEEYLAQALNEWPELSDEEIDPGDRSYEEFVHEWPLVYMMTNL
jgi:hypothetical protein